MKFFIKIILLLLFYLETETTCPFPKNVSSKDKLTTLSGFSNFDELDFSECASLYHNLNGLKIRPNKHLVLNSLLDFENLTIFSNYNPFVIVLERFKGISVNSNPFLSIFITNKTTQDFMFKTFVFRNSVLDFYLNDQLITNVCNATLLKKFSRNLFSSIIYTLEFDSNVSLREDTCPLVFYQSRIYFFFKYSMNSLIVKNRLTFNDNQIEIKLDSAVFYLDIKMYHVPLDLKILNKYVYKELTILALSGVINSIENNMFKSFKSLRVLMIKIEYVCKIFQIDSKWIQSLNTHINFDIENNPYVNLKDIFALVVHQTHSNLIYYEYPDEDYCYFNNFPHHRLVMPLLKPIKNRLNLSCTLAYLIQYSNFFQKNILKMMTYIRNDDYMDAYYQQLNIFDYPYFANLPQYLTNCSTFYEKTIKLCNILKTKSKSTNSYFYIFDWKVTTKFNELIFSLFVVPFFCISSVLTNILTINILSKKRIEETKIYPYLKISSYFATIYTIISFTKLFYVCIESYFNFYYCNSDLSETLIARYYYIIFIRLIANSFKTCSNITYTWFTLLRYITVTDTKNDFLLKLKKVSTTLNLSFSILLSLLLNSYSYFQFSTQEHEIPFDNKFYTNNDINKYSVVYSNYYSINDYSQDLDSIGFTLLKIFSTFKILISDILFTCVSLLIDFLLFLFIKKANAKKNTLNIFNALKTKKKRQQNRTSQKRISSLIVLNGINFLIFRLPSLIISFYGFVYRYDKFTNKHYPNFISFYICRTNRFCNLISDISFCLFSLSYIIQFIIMYILDKNFKKCLKKIYKKIKINFKSFFKIKF